MLIQMDGIFAAGTNQQQDQGPLSQQKQDREDTFCLRDLYDNFTEEQECFVLELLKPLRLNEEEEAFQYVQVHKFKVKTAFAEHLVLQIIDVS